MPSLLITHLCAVKSKYNSRKYTTLQPNQSLALTLAVSQTLQKHLSQLSETIQPTQVVTADEMWMHIHDTTYAAAYTVFGKREHKSPDLMRFDEDWTKMEPAITEKRNAYISYRKFPSQQNLDKL